MNQSDKKAEYNREYKKLGALVKKFVQAKPKSTKTKPIVNR